MVDFCFFISNTPQVNFDTGEGGHIIGPIPSIFTSLVELADELGELVDGLGGVWAPQATIAVNKTEPRLYEFNMFEF